jgi:hypothetical protein
MARAGAILLQSGLETPDVDNVDISGGQQNRERKRARHAGGTTTQPLRRRTRRYAERRASALR